MHSKRKRKGRKLRRWLRFLIGLIVILGVITACCIWDAQLEPPSVNNKAILNIQRQQPSTNFYTFNNNRLQKNEYGLWEMYL